MFPLFIRFDGWLIEKLEAACHRSHRMVGWDNFSYAKFTASVVGIGFGVVAATSGSPWVAIPIAVPCIIMYLRLSATRIDGLRAESLERLMKSGTMNAHKLSIVSIRIRAVGLMLGLPVAQLLVELGVMGNSMYWFMFGVVLVALVALSYFLACDPDPHAPSKSKLRAWIETLGLKPARITTK